MILQKIGIFLVRLITFGLFCAAGIWIGFRAYKVWTKLENSGRFVRWQLLDSQQKFRQIINANRSEVWAQAENGKYYIYKFDLCDETACSDWIESKPSVEFDAGIQNFINSGCENTYQYYGTGLNRVEPRYPPQHTGIPLECAVTMENNPYNGAETLTYFVLLDNGNIWMWKHKPDLHRELELFLAYPLAGLIAGVIIWFQLQKRFL